MKFLLFGTGEYYNRYKIWFARKEVLALIDNSKEKQGQYIDGILVISPEDVQLYRQYEYDAIIILSFYIKAMKTQLIHHRKTTSHAATMQREYSYLYRKEIHGNSSYCRSQANIP